MLLFRKPYIRKKLANFGRPFFVVLVNLYVMRVPTAGGFLRSLLLKPVPMKSAATFISHQ